MATQLDPHKKRPQADEQLPLAPPSGWRRVRTTPSLVEVYRTVSVDRKGFARKLLASSAGPVS